MSDEDKWGPDQGDAFGEGLLARLGGAVGTIVIERDDGLVEVDSSDYFSPPSGPYWDWMRSRIGHRVLDIGAGAGRGSLALEAEGIDVVALDVSPVAVEVCRRRGVAQTFLGTIADLAGTDPEPFDTFLCLGNNLGLLANPTEAFSFLNALRAMARKGAVLVGTMLDPYVGEDPVHLAYHEHNRRAGRMGGQVRIRVRHRRWATPWFDLLWASPAELEELADRAGWEVSALYGEGIYGAELRPRTAGT